MFSPVSLLGMLGSQRRVLTVVDMLKQKGVSETVIYDEAAVKERYGVPPEELPDYKGLVGDASDNIPGVYGIGAKTASSLIKDFGSVEGVYKNVDKVTPESLRKKLIDGYEQAVMSKNTIPASNKIRP